MADLNPGRDRGDRGPSTERLMRYWAHGEGAAKIRWGVEDDFYRCVAQLGKHVPPHMVKGLCSNLHKRATGFRPGKGPHAG
jgi:hypothetical protein